MTDNPANTVEDFIGRTVMGGATILSPSTSVTYENRAELESVFEEVCTTNGPKIVLECRQVKAFDSDALEFLTAWHAKLQTDGGWLKLVGLRDVCADIFAVTRLTSVLLICESINVAIQER